MLQEIVDGLKAEQVPKEDMDEVLFLTAANAVLERIGLNLPEDLSYIFKENLDDYLSIALINKEHNVDLLPCSGTSSWKPRGTTSTTSAS